MHHHINEQLAQRSLEEEMLGDVDIGGNFSVVCARACLIMQTVVMIVTGGTCCCCLSDVKYREHVCTHIYSRGMSGTPEAVHMPW